MLWNVHGVVRGGDGSMAEVYLSVSAGPSALTASVASSVERRWTMSSSIYTARDSFQARTATNATNAKRSEAVMRLALEHPRKTAR